MVASYKVKPVDPHSPKSAKSEVVIVVVSVVASFFVLVLFVGLVRCIARRHRKERDLSILIATEEDSRTGSIVDMGFDPSDRTDLRRSIAMS